MVKTRRVKLIVLLMAIVMAVSVFFGLFVFREKSTSTVRAAEETANVTQVQFRTTGGPTYYFFLRMDGQTDYTTGNELHYDTSFITSTNLLDKVTVYFLDGAASLRDVWTGEYVYTYLWGETHTIAFPMSAGYVSDRGVGARIDAGTEIPMLNGTKKVTSVSRSFWQNWSQTDNVINNYAEGYDTITTSIAKVHLRGAFLIGLGEGNDWNGKGEGYPTQVIGGDGTSSYSGNNWRKMYLSNFTSKIKLHVKETDTWVTLGKILNPPEGAPQCVMVFNGWGEPGGIVRLTIDTAYNGTTIDQILFEKGCELPSYNFVGNAITHTVHVLDKNYLCNSNDMSTVDMATSWSFSNPHRVSFNSGNTILVNDGATVDYPTDLSETKADDEQYSYVYNWFLNGAVYDFSTPVTGDINLTSDGSFTATPKQYTITYLKEDGSVYKTEKVPFGSTLALAAVPEKLGATEGRWIYNGGDLPTTMPAYDITLQASYEADFHVEKMHFRSEGEGAAQWLLMMPNATDYTTLNTWLTSAFLDGTNILDNVTVYFKHGAYSLREVWDGTGLGTKIWGETNAIAFRMKSGFLSKEGVGIQVNVGTEFPMHDGSKLKTMETRTFWSNNDGDNEVVTTYTDGYNEIPVDVTDIHIRSEESTPYKYLLIRLGDGNDWNGKGAALPTQAATNGGDTSHANAYWHKIYLANFMNHVKLHVAASDTWVNLGDIIDTASAGGPMQVLTYNAWGEQGGVVVIPIANAYNGTTIDKVLFEEGCQLPSYDFNANHMAYTTHTLNREQLFVSNDMSLAYWAVSWSTKHEVTFNGGNGVMLNSGECVEYPTHLSETKAEDENYYYIYNWYLDGELYDFSTPVTKSINLTSDGTFTAIAKPKYYTVTFKASNDLTESISVLDGTIISSPEAPQRTSQDYKYTFIGWYNGEDLYDFANPITEDLVLTAKYDISRLLVLSDLYSETFGDRVFKTGEIQIANHAATFSAPKGYYTEYATTPNFELAFDLKYTAASTYSTFTIYMTSSDEINNTSPFYVGWKLWFYRPNDLPIHFQYLQYNGSAADTRVVFAEAGSDLKLAKDTIYTVKISYKVVDASNGTVEMSITIGDWSNTTTYTLGADYFNANAANSNKILFMAESTNGSAASLVAGDPGLIGKARQDVTLMNGSTVYKTDSTNQIVLPALPAQKNESGLDQVFVGWTTDASFGEGFQLYPAGYKLQLDHTTTLHAVWLGFEMQDGAAVRLVANSSGIRFLTDIDRVGYQVGVDKGLILSVGTFVVPTSYLSKVEFAHSSFSDSKYYMDIETKTWRVEGEENATWTYAAALVNISEGQYSRSLSARGYIKVQFTTGVGYIYTPYAEENNARSIYEVATEAYNDTKENYKSNETILTYINSVADLVLDAENGLTKVGVGSYTLTSEVNESTFTFTVKASGEKPIKTVLINGTRMTVGYDRNITIGNFVYSISDYKLDETNSTITFVLKAAENLDDKQSDGLVYFQSSDEDLDFFLNDYLKRHAGNVFENGVDQKVTSVSAGFTSQEFFWQEWFSLAYYPISSMQDGSDARINGLREKLSGVPVDEYGYVWQNTDAVRDVYSDLTSGEHRMGWPFPTSAETHYSVVDKYLWAKHTYDTTYSASWDFNGADRLNGWTSNISASIANGLLSGSVSNRTSNITFTSPTLHTSYTDGNPNSTSDWSNWTHQTTCMVAYYTPLLELDVRMDNASGVQDIIVHYTSTKGLGSVSVNEKAFISYPYEGKYEHMLFLPMYASANWGDAKNTYITSITVEIVMKSGASMSGNVGLSYVRGAFDTRHTNNMALLISALRQDYDYTGDLQYLQENITRARKAINFLMQAYDEERSLIASDYLVGHDSDKSGNKQESQASSLGNGYWDITFMPKYDFHTNTNFYMALTDLAYLEGILESKGITVDKGEATVKTASRDCVYGTSTYKYDAATLTTIAGKVQKALQATTNDSDHTGFWSEKTGRFVAGYSEKEGVWYDYGYLVWNLEAIYYGVATEAQTKSIMDWVTGERIVEGDTSTGEDIYFFELAPRVNTYQGTNENDVSIYTGIYSDQKTMVYGVTQCQNGGAIMYSSFYDLMNRINVYGADNAFDRLQAIQAWYMDIYGYYVTENAGATPDRFYWDYYENSQWDSNGDGTGEYWALQNGIKGIEEREKVSGGIIGVDGEFLESLLPMASIYYGFFGIESVNADTLKIAPKLPGDLQYWKTENLMFCDVKYDLTIRKNALQISSISSDESAKNLSLTAVFEAPNSEYGVYINGFKTNNYRVENGNIYVDVALDNVIIEIR